MHPVERKLNLLAFRIMHAIFRLIHDTIIQSFSSCVQVKKLHSPKHATIDGDTFVSLALKRPQEAWTSSSQHPIQPLPQNVVQAKFSVCSHKPTEFWELIGQFKYNTAVLVNTLSMPLFACCFRSILLLYHNTEYHFSLRKQLFYRKSIILKII